MLAWLKGRGARDTQPSTAKTAAYVGEMPWIPGAALPIPDWSRLESAHKDANAWAAAWLDALAASLGSGYERVESANFFLLSPLEARPACVLLEYLERSRKRVLATLPGIASGEGHGKTVVLVFRDEDSYYAYTGHYGHASAEAQGFSSGMFIDAGYGHFVFTAGPFEAMEPVVVHELTHCLVRHLPIPAWLNEGLAVNTEHRFVPSRPRYRPNELEFMFGRFWTAETIQEFWTGKSFLRPDDGQPLSYELAKLLVQLLDKEHDMLTRFCAMASRDDGGEAAAGKVLGASLERLAEVVLGPGPWGPQPALWAQGTEKGQFAPVLSRPARRLAPGTAPR